MRVFITRTPDPAGPLARWATANGHRLTGRSYLRFAPVPFVPPDQADWWFFYSPRAVEFALLPGPPAARVRLAAMGEGTAAALRAAGHTPAFVGAGTPAEVARRFLTLAAGQRVFFPRARQSRLSVQQRLTDAVTVYDAVCYDNVMTPAPRPVVADVMVFTSPLNVAAYCDHQPLPADVHLLAIGPSTGRALTERGLAAAWPPQPTEAALVTLLTGLT